MVGVSSSAVSRVLNYDEGISVSDETREAIFATAEKIGYKKRVIYPKIENVALLYFVDHEDELEDVFYDGVKDEIIKQAKKMNIQLSIYDRKDGMDHVPKDLSAFIAIGWLTRKEINALYKRCKRGVFIGTSPDHRHSRQCYHPGHSVSSHSNTFFSSPEINAYPHSFRWVPS